MPPKTRRRQRSKSLTTMRKMTDLQIIEHLKKSRSRFGLRNIQNGGFTLLVIMVKYSNPDLYGTEVVKKANRIWNSMDSSQQERLNQRARRIGELRRKSL